ncbi:aminodeoxychorismate/anthranilate synthase component II [Dialister sp.]|jgi:anthranilate synthase component 2|uniref:anthranilate synthase component II n=1 Tax=Dialister sp. TaxID=1955814 RepID=UPI0025DAA253|nr:aminodeoxychorismate/anthranilate synthase component II [Dialister sp.]
MIILIDNYDSFSYNLYQLAGSLYPDIRVVRNDAYTAEELESMNPEAILISPGPGRPEDAGVSIDAIRHFAGKVPILGVCLGHQAICKCFGATVSYAKELVHGKAYDVTLDTESPLFHDMPTTIRAARYHSLAAVESTMPECLRITARTKDGEIMAVEHRDYPIYGLQFHPESIMTPEGHKILENFFAIAKSLKD